jgi:hypothetical protein
MTLLKFLSSTLATVALLATFSSAQAEDREHYTLTSYTVKAAMLPACDDFVSKGWIPAVTRAGAGPVGVFREAEANGVVVVHVLTVLKSAEQVQELERKLTADGALQSAVESFLTPPGAKREFDRIERSVFAAIDGMPKLAKPDTTKSRILNLRIYESPTPEAHAKKVEMFNTGELAIFKRVGLTPVMFGSALSGPRMPNLTYLLVFPDDEARKAAWKKFGPDPEWQTLKAKPGFSDKEIIRKITNILLTPAPYSEI